MVHTLHADNIGDLPELVAFGRELAAGGQVIISPFSATRHEGVQPRELTITPRDFLSALRGADCDLTDCWVVLDLDWLSNEEDRTEFAQQVDQVLDGRAIMFKADPASYGMVRITYDARVMTPRQAMHTSDYRRILRPLDRQALDEVPGATKRSAKAYVALEREINRSPLHRSPKKTCHRYSAFVSSRMLAALALCLTSKTHLSILQLRRPLSAVPIA